MSTSTKPTLLSLRRQANLTTEQLSQKAGVSTTDTYMVEIGGFVAKETAQKVLNAFVALSGEYCTLDDIRFQNIPAQTSSTSQREVARS